jgi:Holliday junction resolvase-like predicted endonuclease
MVARNFRSPRRDDLIGREKELLCFVEVKTPKHPPREDRSGGSGCHRRREIAAVVREYLRRLPPSSQWSFDVVSVYYDRLPTGRPQIELFRNSSLTAENKIRARSDKEVLECLS